MEPKTTPAKLSLDFLSSQEMYRDPRLVSIKDKLMQDYFRQTQTVRQPAPSDTELLRVSATQLRRLLNALWFSNQQKEQRLKEMKAVCATMSKSVEAAVTPDILNFNHSILTQDSAALLAKPQEGDVQHLHSQLKAAEEKIEAEEFTMSQLKHAIEQMTLSITVLKEKIDNVAECHRRLFSRMDEIVILKCKAENKETSSNHDLMRSSLEIDQLRQKREQKIRSVRQKADAMVQEFEANSTALAKRLLIESDVRAHNEQLHEEMLEVARKHDLEKALSGKYTSVIQQTDAALMQLRDIVNSSKFIGLQAPLESLHLDEVLIFYSQLTYQMLSLNSKFTTMSETEVSLRIFLRKLREELQTLQENSQEYSDLAEAINKKWTARGREPLVLEGHFAHALAEVANEPRIDTSLKRSEEFICVVNLCGNEMARRMMSLLNQIEKQSTPLPITLSTTITSLSTLLKPAGQKITLVPPTPEMKKLRVPLPRKNTYQTPLRTPLSFGSAMQPYTRSASVEDSELADNQSIEMVAMGLGADVLREIMSEELREVADVAEAVLGIFSEVQTVRLFVDKARFRDILQTARSEEQKATLLAAIVSTLVADSHSICHDKFQKRTDLLRTLLVSVQSSISTVQQHIASKGEVAESELYRQKSARMEMNDIGDGMKLATALFETKSKTPIFPVHHRMNSPKHLEPGEKESIFSGTEVEDEAFQSEREFFKTRGASLIPGIQRKTVRSKSTEAGSRKVDRLSIQKRGAEFEHGLLGQTQAISQRIKVLVDNDRGKLKTDRSASELPLINKDRKRLSGSNTARKAVNLRF